MRDGPMREYLAILTYIFGVLVCLFVWVMVMVVSPILIQAVFGIPGFIAIFILPALFTEWLFP